MASRREPLRQADADVVSYLAPWPRGRARQGRRMDSGECYALRGQQNTHYQDAGSQRGAARPEGRRQRLRRALQGGAGVPESRRISGVNGPIDIFPHRREIARVPCYTMIVACD